MDERIAYGLGIFGNIQITEPQWHDYGEEAEKRTSHIIGKFDTGQAALARRIAEEMKVRGGTVALTVYGDTYTAGVAAKLISDLNLEFAQMGLNFRYSTEQKDKDTRIILKQVKR